MKFDLEKDKLLVLLLITDLAFILLHILNVYTDLLNSSLYLLSRDRGFAEFFQYTKELWIAVMFLLLGIKKRRGIFYVFSLLFTYLMFDDSFEIHENLGRVIAETFQIQSWLGLRGVDFGELLVSAVFGLLFLAALILFFIISDQITRRIALYMLAMFGLLALFGVVGDMVEVIVRNRDVSRILVIIEEGGEMLVMSVMTWFVFHLRYRDDQLPLQWLPLKRDAKTSKS
ncbi:MAG: hypothetical protein SCH68_12435 [Brevefilum sp.]|nr:hypothetical protein [Brevefilum sp.]